jgi:hypothetical protein
LVLVKHTSHYNFTIKYLSDSVQNVRLTSVVTVSTNSEIDLLGVSGLLEGSGNTKNGIIGSLGDLRPPRLGSHLLGGEDDAGIRLASRSGLAGKRANKTVGKHLILSFL